MNKVTTAALAGLVAVTATANASLSRWQGFGDIGSAFIADVQDIWTLPGAVVNYKSGAYAELGGGSYGDVWGGANMEVGPGVLSIWGNRPVNNSGILGIDVPNYGFVPTGANVVPAESLDAIYGWALNDNTGLGVGVNRASYGRLHKRKGTGTTDTDFEYNANDLGLSLGVEQKNVGPLAMLEVGLQYNLTSGLDEYKDNAASTDDKYDYSGSTLNLRVGGDLAGQNGAFGRVELGFNMNGADAKDEAQGATGYVENKYAGMGYNVGYAAGKSSDKGMGLVGIMLSGRADSETEVAAQAGSDIKLEYGMYKLAAGFAAEGKANSWLTVRGGLTTNLLHNVSSQTTNNSGVGAVRNYSTNDYGEFYDQYGGQGGTATFGTSITIGDLTLDGVLDQDLLWNGPYLLTGSSSGLSTNLSATWVY